VRMPPYTSSKSRSPPRTQRRKPLRVMGSLPQLHQMLLRFVCGRPVSAVTCLFLAWLTTYFAAQGKRALVRIWDNASWHISHEVRQGIRVHVPWKTSLSKVVKSALGDVGHFPITMGS